MLAFSCDCAIDFNIHQNLFFGGERKVNEIKERRFLSLTWTRGFFSRRNERHLTNERARGEVLKWSNRRTRFDSLVIVSWYSFVRSCLFSLTTRRRRSIFRRKTLHLIENAFGFEKRNSTNDLLIRCSFSTVDHDERSFSPIRIFPGKSPSSPFS